MSQDRYQLTRQGRRRLLDKMTNDPTLPAHYLSTVHRMYDTASDLQHVLDDINALMIDAQAGPDNWQTNLNNVMRNKIHELAYRLGNHALRFSDIEACK